MLLFPVVSIFASSPLTTLPPSVILVLSGSFRHRMRTTTFSTYVHIFTLNPPSSTLMGARDLPFPASLLSLPRSHHSCSQAPSLAATVSPPPPSELHCECLVQQPQPLLQYAALPCLCCAARAKRSTASHLGSGEGKGSTSNCRPSQENKTAVTPELIHRLRESECSLTSIDLFL